MIADVTNNTPALGDDGTLYFVTQDNILHALGQDGSLKWKYTGIDSDRDPWIYRQNGEIWAWRGGNPIAFNPDGTVKWIHNFPFYNPTNGPDGRIYVISEVNENPSYSYLHALYINHYNNKPVLVEEAIEYSNSKELPLLIKLLPNHPNPFNPSTTIEFTNAKAGKVDLVVYDIMGRKIRELVSEQLQAGSSSVLWDGKDDSGNAVSSGVYFARLTLGKGVVVRKMLLMK